MMGKHKIFYQNEKSRGSSFEVPKRIENPKAKSSFSITLIKGHGKFLVKQGINEILKYKAPKLLIKCRIFRLLKLGCTCDKLEVSILKKIC